MITGSVSINLAAAKPETWRNRVAGLPQIPDGVRVLLDVGALKPDPVVVRLIREHSDRLHVDVRGTEHAVRGWVAALQSGDLLAGWSL
jgi:hypothetical protein